MTTQAQRDETEGREALAGLKPGDTIRTVQRHCTPSGMTRWIDCYILEGDELRYLSWYVAKATGRKIGGRHEGVQCGGCGMDMGFDLVYSLSQALFPDGFDCIGEGCPANDHCNGDRDYTPGHPHPHAGGYALKQRWI